MSTTPDPDEGQQTKPFAAWLHEQRNGQTHTDLTTGLRDLVAAVQDTGKKGTITLTITVSPMKGGGPALVVSDDVKVKAPEFDRAPAVFYVDDQHNLNRDDPKQTQLPLVAVAGDDDAPLRTVNG